MIKHSSLRQPFMRPSKKGCKRPPGKKIIRIKPPREDDDGDDESKVLLYQNHDMNIQIHVPSVLGKFLRPHQIEGVQFMFDCVAGIKGFSGNGCILADDMVSFSFYPIFNTV